MLKYKPWLDQVHRIVNPAFERSDKIRLDKSERITPFEKKFFQDFLGSLKQEDFIAYPQTAPLLEKIASVHNVEVGNVFLTPGTDAAIKTFFETCVQEGHEVVITRPCFPMYIVYAQLFNAKTIEITYGPGLKFEYEKMLEAIKPETTLVLLANPNSPIGNYLDTPQVETLVRRAQQWGIPFLVDEAYYEYAPGTCVDLIHRYENVGISRTFSKAMGAAGIRIGYVVGSKTLMDKLVKWRLMYEVNQVGVQFAMYLLDHLEEVRRYADQTKKVREELKDLLSRSGCDVISSHCNWIHFHGKEKNSQLIKTLNNYGVLFKSNTVIPYDSRKDWIRLTVGPGLPTADYIVKIIEHMRKI